MLFDPPSRELEIKTKINKWDLIKLKTLAQQSESYSVVSDSLQPHGLQPASLFCPWDFPGKNTGVGSHFLAYSVVTLMCKPQNLRSDLFCVINHNHKNDSFS